MAKTRLDAVFLASFMAWLLLGTSSTGIETNRACLKSIKASLEDPEGLLSSWNFNGLTEGSICSFVGVTCWHNTDGKVLSVELVNMGLKGQFPIGIDACTTLTGLNLSHNKLQGSIPSDIAKILPFITVLDLSSNDFSGEIPSSIADCSHLNFLRLDNNRLTGHIPQQVGWLSRLKIFSVSNNLLSGPVPNFVNANTSFESYGGNAGLCGEPPLRRCNEQYNWRFDYSFKSGFLIGYIVSAISAIVVYASYCVPWIYVGKNGGMVTIPTMVMSMVRKKNKNPEFDYLVSLSTTDFLLENEISVSENFVTRMSFKDLDNATENFSQHNIIKIGQTGTIYKATLANGWSLAVKKFSNSGQSEEQFVTELKILRKLRHDNLLPLLGFCKESKKRLLVYKYMSNGNLYEWLHSSEGKRKVLEWPLRMKIAAGLARVLAWLHHCSEFRVAHLNISSNCILLDQKFEAKLSNFGMATFINPKEINASRGFCMDIEFWEECFIKEDVFNFGVVLLELITGRNSASLNTSDGNLNDEMITGFSSSRSSGLNDVIDKLLIGQGHDNDILKCLKIACNCVHSSPDKRPSMLDVYSILSIMRDRCI